MNEQNNNLSLLRRLWEKTQTRIGMLPVCGLVVFATAAPPRSVMNSRRFMSALKLRRRIVSV